MPERAAEGISKSLGPLRDVVASLSAAATGRIPAGNDRRRLVRRVRAAGVAAVPALVRALTSPRDGEGHWASYLLERLGGARVVERVSRLLEDPRVTDEARGRALAVLEQLNALQRSPLDDDRGPSVEVVAKSVHDLLDSLESAEDIDHAVLLIAHQVPDDDIPSFAAELHRHGGDQAAPLLEALCAAEQIPEDVRTAVVALTSLDSVQAPPCEVRTSRKSPRRTRDPRARGLDLLEAGRFAESRRLLERVVAAHPDDGEALSFLGVACLEMGDSAQALPYLERASALEPDESLHLWNVAAAAKGCDQMCRCYLALQRYLALGDSAPGAAARRREARGFIKEYERTIRRLHPDTPIDDFVAGEHLFLSAFDALRAERYVEAVAGFERVLALVPHHYPSWGNLGAAHFAEGRREEARRCLARALELNPDYEVARENLKRMSDEGHAP